LRKCDCVLLRLVTAYILYILGNCNCISLCWVAASMLCESMISYCYVLFHSTK
jgi:hypothetical protein